MAKDLPYFKFFCSEWNDGDVTLEEFKIQGLFINVCSYYWSNECYLHIDKLKKRFKHNAADVEYLLKSGLLHNENGYLAIHFLDEQQEERKLTAKRNSEAGKKSAARRKLAKLQQDVNEKPTSVEIPLNGNSTNKKREEERREEKNVVYRQFAHLSISKNEVDSLKDNWNINQINDILDRIENYAKNKTYTSLYLTARNWLRRDFPIVDHKQKSLTVEEELEADRVRIAKIKSQQ